MLTPPAQQATIFALASGAGRAPVAVLRLSGGGCASILQALCGALPAPRTASLRRLRDVDGSVLDQALVLWFPAPASFTGEDCAELQLHGSRAVIADISIRLVALGARPAEPGEFSRRGFLNGKLDLLEAEAIADLVEAETTAQRRQALRQMDGALSQLYDGWAQELRRLVAWQEALIDFAEDEVPEDTQRGILEGMARLRGAVLAHLDDAGRGERLRGGLTIVVSGPPNAGKSSLINWLARRDVAIVSAIPGTTRDAIEVRIDLAGVPVTLVDTAGLREAADEIEAEGIRRAHAHRDAADLVIDLREAMDAPGELAAGALAVSSKIDLAPAHPGTLGVSARTGDGMDALLARLTVEVERLVGTGQGEPPLTRARHRAALAETLEHLEQAAAAPYTDLRAEDMRLALQSLGRITGSVGVEDLLDTIFGQFCIGK